MKRIKAVVQSIGPGFITASVVLGPGSIAVASRIGSVYGYALLWIILIAAISMGAFTAMSTRFAIATDRSILETIKSEYGKGFTILIGISAFMAAASFQFGNNLGIATAMQGLTGIGTFIWPLVFTPLGLVLLFWAKNVYSIIEKLMMVLVMIMILAFITNLFFVKPHLFHVLKGFNPFSFQTRQLDEIAALVATTFSLNACIYQSYLVSNKGWKFKDLKASMRDTIAGITVLGLISSFIIITSATALKPQGITVATAGDMAIQLESLFGSSAKYIFSLGLCAAAFSSLLVNAVIGGGLLSDSLGYGRSMQDKVPKILSAVIMLIGMTIAVFFRGNIVYALVMAQASSLLAIPSVGLGLFLIANNKKVMGNLRNTTTQNVFALFGFVLIIIMVIYMFFKLFKMIQGL